MEGDCVIVDMFVLVIDVLEGCFIIIGNLGCVGDQDDVVEMVWVGIKFYVVMRIGIV